MPCWTDDRCLQRVGSSQSVGGSDGITITMGCVQSKPTARRKPHMSQHEDFVVNNNVQVGHVFV